MQLLVSTLIFIAGLEIGKAMTKFKAAKTLKRLDELIYKEHRIKPIIKIMEDVEKKQKARK